MKNESSLKFLKINKKKKTKKKTGVGLAVDEEKLGSGCI